jgi:uncharacterized membrane protein YozB (DUF420 family)
MRRFNRKRAIPKFQVKLVTASFLSLGLVGLALILATLFQEGISVQKGIFGTRAILLSDLNLIAQFVLLVGLSWGVLLARRGHYKAHQYLQTSMVLLNLVLVLSIMVRSFTREVAPGLPGNLKTWFGVISTVHVGFGLLAITCSVYLLLRMNQLLPMKMRNENWKNLMRLTFGLYWIVGLFGLTLYYIWYVL